MSLLIDGHNLIGRMPDLSLADPNDEVLLVQRVRRYCMRHRQWATVVFDAGLAGGPAPHLSAPPVEVVFASSGSSADGIICRRILQARDPRSLLVVSSDHAVRDTARSRGARLLLAEEFAEWLILRPSLQESEEVRLSEGEVKEWLELFGRGEK